MQWHTSRKWIKPSFQSFLICLRELVLAIKKGVAIRISTHFVLSDVLWCAWSAVCPRLPEVSILLASILRRACTHTHTHSTRTDASHENECCGEQRDGAHDVITKHSIGSADRKAGKQLLSCSPNLKVTLESEANFQLGYFPPKGLIRMKVKRHTSILYV